MSLLANPFLRIGQSHLFRVIEDVCQVALAAVLTIVHRGHEDTSAALWSGAFSPQTLDLAITVDLVVLEHSQLVLLALVLDLLWGGVDCRDLLVYRSRHLAVAISDLPFFLRFLAPPRRRRTR